MELSLIWNEKYECMPQSELKALQIERLRETVSRVFYDAPFYRRAFQERGMGPDDVKSLDDLSRLPFTTKNDLRDNYPYGLFTVPLSEVVRVHASSGTTGKPVVGGYTRHDLEVWAEVMARSLTCCGATACSPVDSAHTAGPSGSAPR